MPGWEGVMGLQFENLVLNNRASIWNALELRLEDIVFENPYFQTKTLKQAGCQIDYLIQTRFKNLYICEIKFSHKPISKEVIQEIKEKLKAIKSLKGFAYIPILIHMGGVTKAVKDSDFFAHILDFSDNLSK